MKKLIISIPIIIGIILAVLEITKPVFADNTAYSSASLNIDNKCLPNYNNSLKYYKNKLAIKNILKKYNSPLVKATDNFINACVKYQLNCYLLPAIAGLESTFGKFIYPNSYNPFGWGGGYIIFKNWKNAIETVAQGLRSQYLDKGAETIDQVGIIYSESKTWASKVNYFMAEFVKEEQKNELYLVENPVEL